MTFQRCRLCNVVCVQAPSAQAPAEPEPLPAEPGDAEDGDVPQDASTVLPSAHGFRALYAVVAQLTAKLRTCRYFTQTRVESFFSHIIAARFARLELPRDHLLWSSFGVLPGFQS